MRTLFLLLFLLVAQVAQAQLPSHKTDFYILTATPQIRHYAPLRMHGKNELVVKETSNKSRLTSEEVSSCRIGTHDFLAIENSELGIGSPDDLINATFVEVLDSGKVSLLQSEYSKSVIMPTFTPGIPLPRKGSIRTLLYILRDARTRNNTVIPADGLMGGGPGFRSALQPFLANRADLLKLLTENRFNIEDLPDIVRAINSGNPFRRTPRIPFGID